MDNIQSMLDRLSELTDEELETLSGEIVTTFEGIDRSKPTQETVDQVKALAAAATAVRGEVENRKAQAAEFAAALEESEAAILGGKAEEESAPVDEPVEELSAKTEEFVTTDPSEQVPEQVEEPLNTTPAKEDLKQEESPVNRDPENIEVDSTKVFEPEIKPEDAKQEPALEEAQAKAEEPEEEEEPSTDEEEEGTTVTASGSNGGELVVEAPATHQPVVPSAAVTITAGADIPGIPASSEFTSTRQVAEAVMKRLHGMRSTSGGDGEQHTIATIVASFPEDRVLSGTDEQGNTRKLEAVMSPEAVVAAGGLCAPVTVSYDLFGLGDNGRPVRDSLPVFNADRGGIRFVAAPVLSDLNGAVSVWTVQDDIDAATVGAPDPVKPCLRVVCGGSTEVDTEAIPLCLTFGNLVSRTYPELVERHLELGMIWHARFAEQRLLTRIGALSTAVTHTPAGNAATGPATTVGAARQFFYALEEAAAGYRNRHRMAPDASLRVLLPSWFKNMLRADLTLQLPGDGQESTFGLNDNSFDRWFDVRHINVTWFIDGEAGQILAAQGAGALNPFPSTVVWYLFAEGTFLFLDGGTLDLGVVRDSTLNGTNDYKIFLETFEGVAKVGIESLKITSTIHASGGSVGTVAAV